MSKTNIVLQEASTILAELYNFAKSNGYCPAKCTFTDVLATIKSMRVINPLRNNYNVNVDNEGYITGFRPVETIVDVTYNIPEDIEDGYYILTHNSIQEDLEQKDKLYPDVDLF